MQEVHPPLTEKMSRSVVLKQHYYTADECDIPTNNKVTTSAVHHAVPVATAIAEYNAATAAAIAETKENMKTVLDGFYMLEATGSGFPEEATQAILSDKNLSSIVEDDMSFFTEILFIDASENHLQFHPFGAFPQLRDLRLACNHITNIEGNQLYGFGQMMILDLSYNKLSMESVIALEVLPNLRDLDLCGNNLGDLHDDWQNFQTLEKLLLNYNKLENNDIFTYLSTAPNLRHLGVANNFLCEFPSEALHSDGFKLLDTLDISFNYFSSEAHLEPVTRLPRLTTIQLYGNPVLGPSGEDPMYIYIEGLVDDAIAHRDSVEGGSRLPHVDFMTEIPRKRNLKKGQPLGRQATYRDFSIVQVELGSDIKPNREWREKGNYSIFAEAMQARRAMKTSAEEFHITGMNLSALPDNTFLTSTGTEFGNNFMTVVSNALHEARQQHLLPPHPQHHHHHHHHHPRHHKSHDVVADDVMQKVAGDMGIVNSSEYYALKDKATIRSEALDKFMFDYEDDARDENRSNNHDSNNPDNEDDGADAFRLHSPNVDGLSAGQGSSEGFGWGEGSAAPSAGAGSGGSVVAAGSVGGDATVPGELFKAAIGDVTGLAAQPVVLKTAMKALQMAIGQPLTDYSDVPSKSAQDPNLAYSKPTKCSQNRQMPRKLSQLTQQELKPLGMTTEGITVPSTAPTTATPTAASEGATEGATTTGTAANANANTNAGLSSRGGGGTTTMGTTSSSSPSSKRHPPPVSSNGAPSIRPPGPSKSAAAGSTGASRFRARGSDSVSVMDRPSMRYKQQGLKEPVIVKRLREEQRAETLAQIDSVLEGLNANTNMWSSAQQRQGQQHRSERETMKEMKDFAQPFTGIKSLANMVEDVVQEFES